MIRFITLYMGILVFLLLGGCGTYRMAEIAGNPSIEIATLVSPYAPMYARISVTHIDCTSRGVGWYKRYELLPGWRVVTFSGNSQMGLLSSPKSYVFFAEAGKLYTFEGVSPDGSNDWYIKLLDEGADQYVETIWYPEEYSYWVGTRPDAGICEQVAEWNQTELTGPGVTANRISGRQGQRRGAGQ